MNRPAREHRLDFCVTAEQHDLIKRATEQKGLRSTSEWARSALLTAARRQLEPKSKSKSTKGTKP